MWRELLLVACGGALGSILRYVVSIFVSKVWFGAFPAGTLIVNAAGCFLIGLFVGYITKFHQDSATIRLLLITGFCGGFTTFSAFGMENLTLIQNNQFAAALGNIILNVVLGISAVYTGLMIAR